MRSKDPPPMSARVAMQFRRDGAKRSPRTGAAKLSKAHATGERGWNFFLAQQPQENLRDALSIAVLNSGDVDGYIACVLSGLAGLVFERSTSS
jgi:hypothetical protein